MQMLMLSLDDGGFETFADDNQELGLECVPWFRDAEIEVFFDGRAVLESFLELDSREDGDGVHNILLHHFDLVYGSANERNPE